jgi:hypothetical protein
MALTYLEQVTLIADATLTARVRQGMIDVALEVMAATPDVGEPEGVRVERHRRRTRYAVEVLRAPENAASSMMKALVTLDGATQNVGDAAIKGGVKSLWDAFSEVVYE